MKVEYMIAQRSSEQEQYVAHQQLQQVISYCDSHICRRRLLLAYFGETYAEENCGNCDNCLQPMVVEDRTIDAQKFLSCVGRTQQRFGMRYIIDILRGANTQKIRDYGHDQLSTYGIGKEQSMEEWLRLGRALLQQGLMSEDTTDGYPILRLNNQSREVLRKQRSVEIMAPVKVVQPPREKTSAIPALEPEAQGLLQYLRTVRKQIADELNVAPYTVFTDASLRAMALQRPQSLSHFAQIPGVGNRKLEAYFIPFTNAIRNYCEQYNLAMDLEPPRVEKGQKVSSSSQVNVGPPTRQLTLDLYNQGRSIEEIASERNLKASTIISHLAELIEAGEAIDVKHLIQPGHYEIIIDALQDLGGEALKPVKDFLGDEYSYEEIKLVRALVRRAQ